MIAVSRDTALEGSLASDQDAGVRDSERIHALARAACVDFDLTHLAAPAGTQRWLHPAGFVDVRCGLQPAPTLSPAGRALETYLRTACRRKHADQLGEPAIDAVRLNMLARRA